MSTETPVVHRLSDRQRRSGLFRTAWVTAFGLALAVRPLYQHAWGFGGAWLGFTVLQVPLNLRLTYGWTMTSAEGITWSRVFGGRTFIDWDEVAGLESKAFSGKGGGFWTLLVRTRGRLRKRRYPLVPRASSNLDPDFMATMKQIQQSWQRNVTNRERAARGVEEPPEPHRGKRRRR